MEKLKIEEYDMPTLEGIPMDDNKKVLNFLRDLRTNGYTVLDDNDIGYNLSDELRKEFSDIGFTIHKINFETTLGGEWEEKAIYCTDGYEKDAIEWIFKIWGIDPECLAFENLKNEYPYVKCKWNGADDSQTFVVPVRLLASIRIENYSKGNVLRNIEMMNVD